ncbi:MAG: hypothetical protein QOH42_923, partial [Blastocatellia bacterium]|nr:hypothetical protein [Blastocatellia bacterium]
SERDGLWLYLQQPELDGQLRVWLFIHSVS